jgi:hypothetical protein
MLGSATFTIVVSSTAMNQPVSATARIRHWRLRFSITSRPLPEAGGAKRLRAPDCGHDA